MNEPTPFPLVGTLRRAAIELRDHAPPANLLPAITRALERNQRPLPPVRGSRIALWLGWSGLGTVFAVACVMLLVDSLEPLPGTGAPGPGFVAVASDASRPGAAWLVPTEMSQARLVGLGLPYDPGRAGERMSAQVLVQDGGEVLAVRLAE